MTMTTAASRWARDQLCLRVSRRMTRIENSFVTVRTPTSVIRERIIDLKKQIPEQLFSATTCDSQG
jgi:hypothetical protein